MFTRVGAEILYNADTPREKRGPPMGMRWGVHGLRHTYTKQPGRVEHYTLGQSIHYKPAARLYGRQTSTLGGQAKPTRIAPT